jgi:hypothetical protein
MISDPIVEAVHRTREELASAFNYDVHAIFADMRERESQFGDRLVRQPPRRKPGDVMPVTGSSSAPACAQSAPSAG